MNERRYITRTLKASNHVHGPQLVQASGGYSGRLHRCQLVAAQRPPTNGTHIPYALGRSVGPSFKSRSGPPGMSDRMGFTQNGRQHDRSEAIPGHTARPR